MLDACLDWEGFQIKTVCYIILQSGGRVWFKAHNFHTELYLQAIFFDQMESVAGKNQLRISSCFKWFEEGERLTADEIGKCWWLSCTSDQGFTVSRFLINSILKSTYTMKPTYRSIYDVSKAIEQPKHPKLWSRRRSSHIIIDSPNRLTEQYHHKRLKLPSR